MLKRSGIVLGVLLGIGLTYEVVTSGPGGFGVSFMRHKSGATAIPLALSQDFVTVSLPTPPAGCLLCQPRRDGTANWACYDSNGVSDGGITQGTAGYVGSFPGNTVLAANILSDADAPTASQAFWTNLLASNNMTFMAAGYARDNGSTVEAFGAIADNGVLNNYFAGFEADGNLFKCDWGESGSDFVAQVGFTGYRDSEVVVSCTRTGNNRVACVNDTCGTAVTTAGTRGSDPAPVAYFGKARVANFFLNGPMNWELWCPSALSAAQKTAFINQWHGVPSSPAGALSQLSQVTCVDNTFDSGFVDCFNVGTTTGAVSTGEGLVEVRGDRVTNWWASDALDPTKAVAVNAPAIAKGPTDGPFQRWDSTRGVAWHITDSDNTKLVGIQSENMYLGTFPNAPVLRNNQHINTSGWYAQGDGGATTTHLTMQIIADGGVLALADGGRGDTESCAFTLTGTPTRVSCFANVLDAGTGLYARHQVGWTAAEQGSVTYYWGGFNPANFLEEPQLDDTARGDSVITLNATTWPAFAKVGDSMCYEFVFEPYTDSNSMWDSQLDTVYVFDGHNIALTHNVVALWGYNIAGRRLFRTTGPGGSTDFQVDGVSLTPHLDHAAKVCQQVFDLSAGAPNHCRLTYYDNNCSAGHLGLGCYASTLAGSSLNGTNVTSTPAVPAGLGWCSGIPDTLTLCNRYDGTVPTECKLKVVRIYAQLH